MISIASGYMRTGTSMMMQALIAGGLEPAFEPKREKLNERVSDEDYKLNAGGMWEIPLREYGAAGFPSKYEGKLIKIMSWGLPTICGGEYKVVIMRRDPEEIRQSIGAMKEGDYGDWWHVKNYYRRPAENDPLSKFVNKHPEFVICYNKMMDHLISMMKMRRDVDLTLLNYRDVVDDPYREFEKLAHWGIDVDAAASVVDPKQCRYRLENLTVGI